MCDEKTDADDRTELEKKKTIERKKGSSENDETRLLAELGQNTNLEGVGQLPAHSETKEKKNYGGLSLPEKKGEENG